MPESFLPPAGPSYEGAYREMRELARGIFDRALAECSIERAFARQIQAEDGRLRIGADEYDLTSFSRMMVVSMGKAGHTMAEALAGILETGVTGIIACPDPPPAQLFGFRYFIGGHPLPNADSLRAGEAILRLASTLLPSTVLVCLISGGASAIAEKPIQSKISLGDIVETYKALIHSGAPIAEINAIRKHLSALKGEGWLRPPRRLTSYQSSYPTFRKARLMHWPQVQLCLTQPRWPIVSSSQQNTSC